MKYRYFYQTSANENRDGWVVAPSRAEAYATLRRQGIRPYRVVGDDPLPWRPWAAAALIFALSALVVVLALRPSAPGAGPAARQQLVGDRSLIFDAWRNGWKDYLSSPLDRYLAAYAQPGTEARVPLMESAELLSFAAEAERDVARSADDPPEVVQLKNILDGMRRDFRSELAAGKTVAEVLEGLERRQQEERELRVRAAAAVDRAPEAYRYRAWRTANDALLRRGIEQLPVPEGMRLED